jgi:GMP synthase (glutamine-hydrolysing)
MCMRRLLVFQHVSFEILGTLHPLLKARGFRIRYANFGRHPEARPEVSGYNGLVVLGGPMNVDDLTRHPHLAVEVELIRQAIDQGMPVLGVCLGAQLIAKALGAPVYANGGKEIGWYEVSPTSAAKDDPLFKDFEAVEKLFQWHGDTFALPAGAVHLAASPSCPGQAFRYGSNVYGFQFHLEVDEPLIERWLRVPAHGAELAAGHGRSDPEVIRRETALYIHRSHDLGDQVFGRFIDLFNLPPKRAALRSR